MPARRSSTSSYLIRIPHATLHAEQKHPGYRLSDEWVLAQFVRWKQLARGHAVRLPVKPGWYTHICYTHTSAYADLLTQKDLVIAFLQAKQAGVHAAIEQAKSAQDSLAALRAQNAELAQQLAEAATRMTTESEQVLAYKSKSSLELKLVTTELMQTAEQLAQCRESERFLRAATEEQDVRIAVLMGKLEQAEQRMEALREEHRSARNLRPSANSLNRPARHWHRSRSPFRASRVRLPPVCLWPTGRLPGFPPPPQSVQPAPQ